jgi:hypothetical protein
VQQLEARPSSSFDSAYKVVKSWWSVTFKSAADAADGRTPSTTQPAVPLLLNEIECLIQGQPTSKEANEKQSVMTSLDYCGCVVDWLQQLDGKTHYSFCLIASFGPRVSADVLVASRGIDATGDRRTERPCACMHAWEKVENGDGDGEGHLDLD